MGDDFLNQSITRNETRPCLTVPYAIFFSALIICIAGVPVFFHLSGNQTESDPCHVNLSVPLSNPIFHPNGSAEADGEMYPAGFHFTRNGTTRGCLCNMKPCIRKCCDRDEYFVKIPNKRVRCEKNLKPSPFDKFSLPVHKNNGERVEIDQDHFRVLYGDICIHGMFILDPENPADQHHLMMDGRLQHSSKDYLDVSEYCLESKNGSEEIRVFVCFPDQTPDVETKTQQLLYPIAMIVSMPFLVTTIFVYFLVPELWTIHGKCLVCQCVSLLMTYILLTVIQLDSKEISSFWCILLAFMAQFSMLGTFFWLNVMSFDFWWTISGLRSLHWGLKETEQKRFLLYSLYAWGVPLIIVAISVTIDMIPSTSNSFIKPRFGELKCWFADWEGTLLYFYLPSGIVMGLNVLMFIATTVKLRAHTKDHHNKDRFDLYLRLFIVMGLTWTMELVSFFVGGPKSIWFVTDVCNALQGVIIFFFFVCNQKVLQQLNKKVCPSWNIFIGTSPENSRSHSSSISLDKIENVALNAMDSAERANNEESQSHVT